MSIIYEALKKAEKLNKPATGQATVSLPGPDVNESKKISYRRTIIASMAVALIALGVWAAGLRLVNITGMQLFSPFQTGDEMPPVVAPSVARRDTAESVKKKYALEGIIQGGDSSFVIVNGKVLRVSDKIDDYVLTDITDEKAELVNPQDGDKITLSLSF